MKKISTVLFSFIFLGMVFGGCDWFQDTSKEVRLQAPYPNSEHVYGLGVQHYVELDPPGDGAGVKAQHGSTGYIWDASVEASNTTALERWFYPPNLGQWASEGAGMWNRENMDPVWNYSDVVYWWCIPHYNTKPVAGIEKAVPASDEGFKHGRVIAFPENPTRQQIEETVTQLRPEHVKRLLDKAENNRKDVGHRLFNQRIFQFAPQLSGKDIEHLHAFARRYAYGEIENSAFSLGNNYPDPFNPRTTIPYTVLGEQARVVSLNVFNLNGQLVKTLVHEAQSPGSYTAFWDGRNSAGKIVASGVYLYRIEVDGIVEAKRMVLAK